MGVPVHWYFFGSRLTEKIVKKLPKGVILQENKAVRFYYGPEGELPTRSYAINSEEFDRALAKKAVRSGAEIIVNTRVTDLLKENGYTRGVVTSSRDIPTLRSKVVICADGLSSSFKGLAQKELGSQKSDRPHAVIMTTLTNVKGVEAGIPEWYIHALTKELPYTSITPLSDVRYAQRAFFH